MPSKPRQPINEEPALQMIDLMLEDDRQQSFRFNHHRLAKTVLAREPHMCRASDALPTLGQTQAAFNNRSPSLDLIEHGISHDQLPPALLRWVGDKELHVTPDLRRRKTDAVIGVHGVNEITRQSLDVLRKDFHAPGFHP